MTLDYPVFHILDFRVVAIGNRLVLYGRSSVDYGAHHVSVVGGMMVSVMSASATDTRIRWMQKKRRVSL